MPKALLLWHCREGQGCDCTSRARTAHSGARRGSRSPAGGLGQEPGIGARLCPALGCSAELALNTASRLRICAEHHLTAGRHYCDPRQGSPRARGRPQRRGVRAALSHAPRGPRRAGSAHALPQQAARSAVHSESRGEPALLLARTTIIQTAGADLIGSGGRAGRLKRSSRSQFSRSSPRRVTPLHMRGAGGGKGCPALRCSSRPNWLLGRRVRCSRPHWLSGARMSPLAPPLAAGARMRAAVCRPMRSEARQDVICRGSGLRARPAVRAGSAPLVCRPRRAAVSAPVLPPPPRRVPLQQPLRSARWRRREGPPR